MPMNAKWLALCALLCLVSCIKTGPSVVGRGEAYSTGRADYDAFFTKFHELELDIRAAPQADVNARNMLAQTIGAPDSSSPSALARAVRQRADTLAQTGTLMRFDIDDDDESSARVEIVTSGRKPKQSEQAALQAIEAVTLAELKLSLRMSRAKRDLETLHFAALRLDQQLDVEFRQAGPRKKAEVRSNLADAVALLPILNERADEAEGSADKLVRKLTDATRPDAIGTASARANHTEEPPRKAAAEAATSRVVKADEQQSRSARASATPRTVEAAVKRSERTAKPAAMSPPKAPPAAGGDFEP
jgi:hypothetical protein